MFVGISSLADLWDFRVPEGDSQLDLRIPATCDLLPVAPFIVRTSDYLQAVPRATRNNKSDKYVTCEVLPAQRQRLVP